MALKILATGILGEAIKANENPFKRLIGHTIRNFSIRCGRRAVRLMSIVHSIKLQERRIDLSFISRHPARILRRICAHTAGQVRRGIQFRHDG